MRSSRLRSLLFWTVFPAAAVLVAVAVLGLLLGLAGRNKHRLDTDEALIRHVKHMGGSIRENSADIQLDGAVLKEDELRELVQLLHGKHILQLRLNGANLTDEMLKDSQLFVLDIAVLDISNTHVTGRAIETINRMKQLRVLSVYGTEISWADLNRLRFGTLRRLEIGYSPERDRADDVARCEMTGLETLVFPESSKAAVTPVIPTITERNPKLQIVFREY